MNKAPLGGGIRVVSGAAGRGPGSVQTLVDDIQRLVALPEAWVRISREIDAGADARRIAAAIEMDTDLSARLLRIVNSSVYRLAAPVETISRAVTIIGTEDLRDLATLTVARRLFTGIPADLMDIRLFWRASVQTGVFAGLLGGECRMLHPERVFVMGVLSNIGLLVECQYLPEKTREALYVAADDHAVLAQAESEILGFNHAEVGAALLYRWGLPDTICRVAGYHHRPADADGYGLEVEVVHTAGVLSEAQFHDLSAEEALLRTDDSAIERLDLDAAMLTRVMEEGRKQVDELVQAVASGTQRHGGGPRR